MSLSRLVVSLELACPTCRHPRVQRDDGAFDRYICPMDNRHAFKLHDGRLVALSQPLAPPLAEVVRRSSRPPPIRDARLELDREAQQLKVVEAQLARARYDVESCEAERAKVAERVARLQREIADGA